jgi:hypothetical protein
MNPDNRRDKKSSDNNRTAKAITAMTIAGILVAASLLLSGLSLVMSYHPALAQQQNMTGGGGGNATSTGAAGGASQSEVMMHLEEVRKALQNNDVQGAMMHLDLAMNLLSGGGSTQGNMTSTTGSTSSTG